MEKELKRTRAGEYLVPGLIGVIGAVLFVESYSISVAEAARRANIITSDFFPRIIAGALVVLSVATIVLTYFRHRKATAPSPEPTEIGNQQPADLAFSPVWGVLVSLGLMAVFFVMFKPVGFILAAFVYTAGYLYVFGSRKILPSLLYSLVYVAVVFVTFRYAFRVMPPGGILY